MPNPPSSRGSRSATKTPGLNVRVGRRLPDEAEIASIHLVPGYLVRRLHVICQRIFSDAIGVSGMLPGHMGLLATRHTYPEIDQRSLGAIIGSDPVTTGQLLHLLERRGHVVRTVDPADRRARRLSLTPSMRAPSGSDIVTDRVSPALSVKGVLLPAGAQARRRVLF